MAVLLPNGKQQYDAANGVPAVGYQLFTYDVGTTNPRTTWSNEGQSAANTNPIILDARGEAVIFWSGDYTVTLKDNVGSTIWSVDGVNSNAASLTDNYVIDTGTANAYVANGITASVLVAGLKVAVKIANNNTAASTLNYGGLGVKSVIANGSALHGGELKAGVIYIFEYDGTNFQLLNPSNGATVTEIAAGVVPSNINFSPGDPRRYNAKLDGVTDDTAALTQWASVRGDHTFPGALISVITGQISLIGDSNYTFGEGGIIQTAVHDISMFSAVNKSNITVRGGKFIQTSVGIAANVAGILLDTCTYCLIEDNEFVGMQCCGIRTIAPTKCIIRNNNIHDGISNPVIQSSADIAVESSASLAATYNIVEGNECFGAAEFGISCWDPYTGLSPLKNVIIGNRIGAHRGYGVLFYFPFAGDSFNQVVSNDIQDINAYDGAGPNISSGAGIYVVGAGAGGTQIIGNSIRNCCLNTANATLAPGGIGVSTTSANTTPIVIANNTIDNMTQYHGILVTGLAGGASITGNTMRMPAANITGDGIRVTNCNNVSVNANTVLQLNSTTSQRGIIVFAQTANCTNISISGNTVSGGHQSYIETVQSGGFLVSGLTISGNIGNGGDNTCIPLLLNNLSAADVLVTGNYFSGGTAAVLSQTACTNARYSNNRLKGTGTTILLTAGVNTGSYYDKTNAGTSDTTTNNTGTGFLIEQFGSVIPTTGTHGVGDARVMSVPVVASPKGWRATVAGSPGTWVSEGNL